MLKTLKKDIEPLQNFTGSEKRGRGTGQTLRFIEYQMKIKR